MRKHTQVAAEFALLKLPAATVWAQKKYEKRLEGELKIKHIHSCSVGIEMGILSADASTVQRTSEAATVSNESQTKCRGIYA